MILFDVNVLVYAHRADSTEHERYAEILTRAVASAEPFGCSELALSGFVRIVTHARIFATPTPIGTAIQFCRELVARPNCRAVRPGPGHFAIFLELCGSASAKGKLVADAYHAALAIEHGCELWTSDADFARFAGLRWRHPLAG